LLNLERFSNSRALAKAMQGGFFLRKKQLGFQVSLKSRIENAVKSCSFKAWFFSAACKAWLMA
jgi:hypothetical protein